jgi:hypothetical protein
MSGSGIDSPSTVDWREPIGQHQMARPVRRMVSAAMLLTAFLAACLVLGASGLSGDAHAASTSASECIAGTGAPLPPALTTAGAAGCHGYTAPTPSSAPTPLALEPGALPVVQALPGASANLSAGLAPLVLTPGSRESFYWYSLFATKTEPQENCWQTGVLGSSSYACDSVGASYLPSGPHMHEVSEQGVGEDFQISPSGDYCNYYRLGEALNTTNGNKQSGYSGYEPPTPLGSYQEGNSHISPPNVCQAYETFWGQVLQGSGNSKCETRPPCGMQHYVSLHEQAGNDRPWGSSFGEPSLVISDDVLPYSLGTHGGAWGYLCPLFEDQTTGDILESCLEEWRVGSGYPSTNEHFDVVSACASGGSPAHNIDQTITQFASGTSFAENIGSEKTFVFGSNSTWRDFSARITRANLESAITADRRNHPFSKKEVEEAEKGERSWSEQGCGRSLSTNPANYALIGIEQGVEGGGLSEIGASDANLQLWTEYTPLPPEATTNTASGVQQTQATLNGTVNPKGTDTHYYFQYGKTTEYGSSTSSTDAGSGTTSLLESATVTGLQPGTIYHYRLVATSAGGTVYGSDQTFTALVGLNPAVVRNSTNGDQWVYYQGANGQMYQWLDNGLEWQNGEMSGEAAAAGGSPTVVRDPTNGDQWVYYVGQDGNIYQWLDNGTSWQNNKMGGGELAAAGSSPTVVRNPTNGNQWVYYQGANGQIYQWLDNGSEWKNYEMSGEAAAAGGSPTVVRNETTGEQWVYYQGANGQIYQWLDNGSEWKNYEMSGEAAAAGGSPTVVRDPTNGDQWVYYVGQDGNIYQWLDNGTSWQNNKMGGGELAAAGSSPTVVRNPTNGNQWVYYQGANGQIYQWLDNGSEWKNYEMSGEAAAAGGSPTVVRNETTGEQWVYYQGANGQIYQWLDNGSEWKNYEMSGEGF